MKISDLLSAADVAIDVRASNKALLLQEFATRAAAGLGLPADRVASYLLKREELGSTGIGKGVAIPHARLPDLQRPCGLLARLKQPIEFDFPTDLVPYLERYLAHWRPILLTRGGRQAAAITSAL